MNAGSDHIITEYNTLITMQETELAAEYATLCRGALSVVAACNLSGVVNSFARDMGVLWKVTRKLQKGSGWINEHAVCILYTERCGTLTKYSATGHAMVWSDAYHALQNFIEYLDDQ